MSHSFHTQHFSTRLPVWVDRSKLTERIDNLVLCSMYAAAVDTTKNCNHKPKGNGESFSCCSAEQIYSGFCAVDHRRLCPYSSTVKTHLQLETLFVVLFVCSSRITLGMLIKCHDLVWKTSAHNNRDIVVNMLTNKSIMLPLCALWPTSAWEHLRMPDIPLAFVGNINRKCL